MKITHFVVPTCALALAACGGGSEIVDQQQQNTPCIL
jgi:hypothetical protein